MTVERPDSGQLAASAEHTAGSSHGPAGALADDADSSGWRPSDDQIITPQPTDDEIVLQHNIIRAEEAQKIGLIGSVEPLDALKAEYESGSQVFVKKIESLAQSYACMRRTRGDGNCFFRSFIFSYLEHLLSSKDSLQTQQFTEQIRSCDRKLKQAGYQELVYEDSIEVLLEQLNSIATLNGSISLSTLEDNFRDDTISNMVVLFLRLVAAAEIQSRQDFFAPFILGDDLYPTVEQFCRKNVEVMGEESDHVHIVSLTDALQVPLRVQYLDSTMGGSEHATNFHDFIPESCRAANQIIPKVHLLYRPGHYDILYRRD